MPPPNEVDVTVGALALPSQDRSLPSKTQLALPLPFSQLQLLMQIPTLLVIGSLISLHGAVWGPASTSTQSWSDTLLLLISWMAGLVVHELLHAAAFIGNGAAWQDIHIGFRRLTLYFQCEAAVPASGFRSAVALPALILGVIPAAAGLSLGLGIVIWFGAIMLSASLGDLLVLWVVRSVPDDAQIVHRPQSEKYEITIS